jgi:hypothetical protein
MKNRVSRVGPPPTSRVTNCIVRGCGSTDPSPSSIIGASAGEG